ncbi:MAG: chaperonin GroEL, partial [Parachlamydiales bacterium]
DEAVGDLIAEAMEKAGKDGAITIAEAKGTETTLDLQEGLELGSGYLSPYFVTFPEKMSTEMEKGLIFITDKKLSSAQEVVKILEAAFDGEAAPLLIVAGEIEAEALNTLVLNKVKGALPLSAIKAPAFGEERRAFLEDLAVLTGAEIFFEEAGLDLKKLKKGHFGRAGKISVFKDKTMVVGGLGQAKKIKASLQILKTRLQKAETEAEKAELEKRIARLSNGVAVISVGAFSETELKIKKELFENALRATKAAVLQGVVAGGGVALLRAVKKQSPELEMDEKAGFEIVRKACFKPLELIASNAGRQGEVVAQKVFEAQGAFGYNALKDEFEKDLIKAGIIDPVLVVKSALQNAVSVASMLLSAAVLITDKPESKKAEAPMMNEMGGMGGMGGFGGGMGGMGGFGGGMGGMDLGGGF